MNPDQNNKRVNSADNKKKIFFNEESKDNNQMQRVNSERKGIESKSNNNQVQKVNSDRKRIFLIEEPYVNLNIMKLKPPINNIKPQQQANQNQFKQMNHMKIIQVSPSRPLSEQQSRQLTQPKEEEQQQQDLFKTIEQKCNKCNQKNSEKDPIEFVTCNHQFHKSCLKQICLASLNNKQYYVKCPICQMTIRNLDFTQTFQTQVLESFRSLEQAEIIMKNYDQICFCLQNWCSYSFFYDQSKSSNHLCPQCLKRYCLQCFSELSLQDNDHNCQIKHKVIQFKQCCNPQCRQYNQINKNEFIVQSKKCQSCSNIYQFTNV